MNRNHKIRKEHTAIDEDQLLAYLEGNMSPEEQHVLEEVLESDPFLNDAVEGLAAIKDKEQLRQIAAQINQHLRHQVKKRKHHRRRSRHKLTEHWGWLYVLIVLGLALVAWLAIRFMER